MKIIDAEKFGMLYDKLYERIQEAQNLEGLGQIEWGVKQGIWKMWKGGQKYEAILLLISYHYTRNDSLIITVGQDKYVIRQKMSVAEIMKLLGLPVNLYQGKGPVYKVQDKLEISEYAKKYEELTILFSGYKRIGKILEDKLGLRNSEISHFCRAWKEKRTWEAITEIIVYMGTRECDLEVETPRWTKIFPRKICAFEVVSMVEEIK